MATLRRILDSRGHVIRRPAPEVRGRYDAAQNTDEFARHWAMADHLSARAANSPDVRLKLRNRARYEAANNSYCSGIVETLASDLIGAGPRLQSMTGDEAADREIEAAFSDFAVRVCLASKLRVMRKSRAIDGEAFLTLDSDPTFPDVKLDLQDYEADQFATPYTYQPSPSYVDGIELDPRGKPQNYHLLRVHPGDLIWFGFPYEFDRIPARFVVHWFRRQRPRQYRGIPDITPAINLFALLRRYTLAVLRAAETAADYAAVAETDIPPELADDAASTVDSLNPRPFDVAAIERGMMQFLPQGWKLGQLKAEQPTTTYQMFKQELLLEIARCVPVPRNIIFGDSSSYNYSSGQLDHGIYYRAVEVERRELEYVALDPIFYAWLAEAGRVLPSIPRRLADERIPHRWLWPALEGGDPEKEANAQEIRLRNLVTSWSDECQRAGLDPDAQAERIAADLERFEKLGIPIPQSWKLTPAPSPQQSGPPADDSQPSDGGYDDVEAPPDRAAASANGNGRAH